MGTITISYQRLYIFLIGKEYYYISICKSHEMTSVSVIQIPYSYYHYTHFFYKNIKKVAEARRS